MHKDRVQNPIRFNVTHASAEISLIGANGIYEDTPIETWSLNNLDDGSWIISTASGVSCTFARVDSYRNPLTPSTLSLSSNAGCAVSIVDAGDERIATWTVGGTSAVVVKRHPEASFMDYRYAFTLCILLVLQMGLKWYTSSMKQAFKAGEKIARARAKAEKEGAGAAGTVRYGSSEKDD